MFVVSAPAKISFNLLVAISTVNIDTIDSACRLTLSISYVFYVSQNNYMLQVYISAYIHIVFSVLDHAGTVQGRYATH